mgnify:CR=1 FL=1
MKLQYPTRIGLTALGLALSLAAQAQYQPDRVNDARLNTRPAILKLANFDQRLNQQVPLNLTFLDESGRPVRLQQYFGDKPVILSLVYYQCPMLCSQVVNGMTQVFSDLKFNVGRDFQVITVSFDPHDTPAEAAAEKQLTIKRYGRPGAAAGWHFLTGEESSIRPLADAVGFHYAWDPQMHQFAHAAGIVLLTPQGRVAQYYFGIDYPPRDVRLGLVEASHNQIGNVVDQVLLYCYHYDPAKGRYGAVAFTAMRIGGVLTMLLLGGFIALTWRKPPDKTGTEPDEQSSSRRAQDL